MAKDPEEDESKVKAFVATCNKCGGAVAIAVKEDPVRKETVKTFAGLMKDGCDIHTTNVVVARTVRWCFKEPTDGTEPCEGMWPSKKKIKK